MEKIEFKSNFGRFAYVASCEVGEEVNEGTKKLALAGIANTCFRAVGSEAEKALVKAGKAEKDQKRSEIVYSAEAAAILADAAQKKLDALVESDGLPRISFTVQGEHEYGEGQQGSRKQAQALLAVLKANPAKMAVAATVYGFDEDSGEEEILESLHAFLGSLRAKKS